MTNSYGARTVAIIERPQVTPPPFEDEGQQFEFEDDNANQKACRSLSSEEPLTKKMKTEKPATKIMMQHPTFAGLKELRMYIDYKLKKLEEMSGFVNRVPGIMIDVIKTEEIRINDAHLLDRTYIGLIFTELEDKMKELALNQLMFSNFSESSLEILFLEIYA